MYLIVYRVYSEFIIFLKKKYYFFFRILALLLDHVSEILFSIAMTIFFLDATGKGFNSKYNKN